MRIEDYALIGDCQTAALVARNGSIDWLCWPRFDSPACFAALLGGSEHGHWRIFPKEPVRCLRRAYRRDTLILETELETDEGRVVGLANDVGLLAEEYDPATGRLLGNFPQAFSHVALVNSALNLCGREKPAEQRAEQQAPSVHVYEET